MNIFLARNTLFCAAEAEGEILLSIFPWLCFGSCDDW